MRLLGICRMDAPEACVVENVCEEEEEEDDEIYVPPAEAIHLSHEATGELPHVAGGTACGKRPAVQPEIKFHIPQYPNETACQPAVLYQAKQGDPLDEAVQTFFQQKPHVFKRQAELTRLAPGRYSIYGREVLFELAIAGIKGKIYVKDGPLTQPLDDYLAHNDGTAVYSDSVTRSALDTIPQDCRMTFYDSGVSYSRMDAMKVAKEQAIAREKAAVMANNGDYQTAELRTQYTKTIDAKLRKSPAAGTSVGPK